MHEHDIKNACVCECMRACVLVVYECVYVCACEMAVPPLFSKARQHTYEGIRRHFVEWYMFENIFFLFISLNYYRGGCAVAQW